MTPGDQATLTFPVLIGDIGGTNARFALLTDTESEAAFHAVVRTADHPSIDAAILDAVYAASPLRPKSAVLAVAGPVDGDEIDLTNAAWVIRPLQMLTALGLEEIVVLNDFEAQALAVAALPAQSLQQLGPGAVQPSASRVVLGPGTGLGVAGLVQARGLWIPVAGEGGHVDFGPRTPRDEAIWPYLQPIEGRISAEQILCGRGLVNLYQAICQADGRKPDALAPAAVTEAALTGDDRQALEAVHLFASYLGRLAGDLALIFMARGGVYIGGGIFQRLLALVDPQAMRESFEDKAPHRHLLQDMPLFVVTEPLAALVGIAAFARTPGRFGVELAGRRWTAAAAPAAP
ncbi:glucokinase [Mangrovibrevibacter kandeliae]|uniref:glucokinase n=1 Tax=Mangrovibrevibacter kandeliae TaxID=2968473 RepID=UPI0035587DB4